MATPSPPTKEFHPGLGSLLRKLEQDMDEENHRDKSGFDRRRRAAKIEAGPDIKVTKSGFSEAEVTVYEGQNISFSWEGSDQLNVVQVVTVESQSAPVPGGYSSGEVSKRGRFSIQFNLAGDYLFISDGFKKKSTSLLVHVNPRPQYNVPVTDAGFSQKIISIDEGNSINFLWRDNQLPHSVTQLEPCDKHCGFIPRARHGIVPTPNGSYKHEFQSPGLFYFETQVKMMTDQGLCIVHVNEVNREYRVEVKERRFDPMILLLEQGDKVWFNWNNTQNAHCIYQIDPPPLDHSAADEYTATRGGFKWHEPTRTGLLAHQFTEPGVYFYTDRDASFAAEYIGTIIVRPKQREHFIQVQPSQFNPGVCHARTGDRIWWEWTPKEMRNAFSLKQIEACLSPAAKDAKEDKCAGNCRRMSEKQIVQFCKTGMQTSVVNSIGVYHYKIPEVPNMLPTSSIIIQPGEKNFTVKVEDSGFSPRFITVHPGCRVWFVWQGGENLHNIQQVTYQGSPVADGFCSGKPRQTPSAFVHQFTKAGVFYFVDKSLPRLFGAVIVSTPSVVHHVGITAKISPDPVRVRENDVVCWNFQEEKIHDVEQIYDVDQAVQGHPGKLVPRRTLMNRAFADDGVYHFTSLSMVDRRRHDSSSSLDTEDYRISSVIVDEQKDGHVVRVDAQGFHPRNITVPRGASVLWTWKGEEGQQHNIVHVSSPDSESPLSVVEGRKSFNSGKPTANNSYMYTFDDEGYFCVASQGAPGYAGTVSVIQRGTVESLVREGKQCAKPYIDYTEPLGGTVPLYHTVELKCETDEAEIYYTIDGSTPLPYHKKAKPYDKEKGVVLKYPGLMFIRACAVVDGLIDSQVYTSRRFQVADQSDETTTISESQGDEQEQRDVVFQYLWQQCQPQISAYFVRSEPGEMNVSWEALNIEQRSLVKGYRLFVNGVLYCPSFPSSYSAVSVQGLAGGHQYEIVLECIPNVPNMLPHRSNRVALFCNEKVESGAPLISLERPDAPNDLIIVWKNISTRALPVAGYVVYLNGAKCGEVIRPNAEMHRCRAIISCQLDVNYQILVAAVPVDGRPLKLSNELSVMLPLDTRSIILPPPHMRSSNDVIYREYLEVQDANELSSDEDSETETLAEEEEESETETETELEATATETESEAERTEPEGRQYVISSDPEPSRGDNSRKRHRKSPPSHPLTPNPSLTSPPSPKILPPSVSHFDFPRSKKPVQLSHHIVQEVDIQSTVTPTSVGVSAPHATPHRPQLSLQTPVHIDIKAERFAPSQIQSMHQTQPSPAHPAVASTPNLATVLVDGDSQYTAELKQQLANQQRAMQQLQQQLDQQKLSQTQLIQSKIVSQTSNISNNPPMQQAQPTPASPAVVSTHTPVTVHADADSRQHTADLQQQLANQQRVMRQLQQQLQQQSDQQKLAQAQLAQSKIVSQKPPIPPNITLIEKEQVPFTQNVYYMENSPVAQKGPVVMNPSPPPQHDNISTSTNLRDSQRQTSLVSAGSQQQTLVSRPAANTTIQNVNVISAVAQPMNSRLTAVSEEGSIASENRSNFQPANPFNIAGQIAQATALNQRNPSDQPTIKQQTENDADVAHTKMNVFTMHPPQLQVIDSTGIQHPASYVSPAVESVDPVAQSSYTYQLSVPVVPEPPTEPIGVVKQPGEAKKPTDHVCPPSTKQPTPQNLTQVEVEVHRHDDFPLIRERAIVDSVIVPVDVPEDVMVAELSQTSAEPTKPAFISPPTDYQVPVPVVTVEHQTEGELITWQLSETPDIAYRLTSFVVSITGEAFSDMLHSDVSFDCLVNKGGEKIHMVQHVWNVTDDHKCLIRGLVNGETYRIYVTANWTFMAGSYPIDTQTRSTEFDYTTIGAPKAPRLRAVKTDMMNQLTIEWEPAQANKIPVAGYRVMMNGRFDHTINGKPATEPLPSCCTTTVIDKLPPGKSVKVQVIALTGHQVGDSRPSNTLEVTCPFEPQPPLIVNRPSYKKGLVILGWDAPSPSVDTPGHPANITYYTIYVDGTFHGEIKANQTSDTNGYQYYLHDLSPGVSYDITVKSISGQKQPEGSHVFCLCESGLSNTLPVTVSAPPSSPQIYVEGLSPEGIDITWEMPQQYGEADLSGYQLLKNDAIYGSTIPPEVTSMRVKDVGLGDTAKFQIIALTEHPVGAAEKKEGEKGENLSRYAECKPGPKLTVQYSGLVTPVYKVWTEKVTGHSVLVVWKHKTDRQKAHFLPPDNFQVTWWPGELAEGHINSSSTTSDHLLITDLTPNTTYTMIVEARRKQDYVAVDDISSPYPEEITRHFIVSAKSQKLTVRTGQPPEPVSNVGVLASTCHSIQVGWDPPKERGVEVKLVRIDCIPVKKKVKSHISRELLPTETVISLNNLCEHTEYEVILTAITEEFFDELSPHHEWKESRVIPSDVMELPNSDWLPQSKILVRTSGTEPPTDVTVSKITDTVAELTWNPAVVFGNNRLISYVVRWTKLDPYAEQDAELYMEHINLHKRETSTTIKNLVAGFQYKIVVEAVVSVKTAIEAIDGDEEKNRRTTHIPSSTLFVRARAPVKPPTVLVTGYTPFTANLYWDKPVLCTAVARDANGKPIYMKRYLEGYRLYINGKLHMKLDSAAQSVTLTKCKPGKSYDVSLVALTSTEAARREKKRGIRAEDDSDESMSESVNVRLPSLHAGNFDSISSTYVEESNKDVGSVHVKWIVQSHADDVKQWNIVWYDRQDGVLHKSGIETHKNSCIIPVHNRKHIYEISIEPEVYGREVSGSPGQRMQVVVPGTVDAPEIFLRSVNEKDFTIEWGEPRLYGAVRVKGYQLYLNDKKIGRILSSTHRKAVIPCRANRQYKVCMQAIGSVYGTSPASNCLFINTPGSRFCAGELLDSSLVDFESWEASDQTDLKIRTSQVTDTTLKIDWSYENKPKGVQAYKIIWSCATQPRDREVRVDTSEADYSLVLQKLLPGVTHYIRVIALGDSDLILEKSKQIVTQTSAPPECPAVGVRAANFKYITIQWQKPKVYGNTHISGYRVYIDGICEAVNQADQMTYNFTTGKFCQEYSFQVQAFTDNDLTSKPSDPLLVKWPGVIPPMVRQLPSEANGALKMGWDLPYCTDGVKIKHYKAVCREGDTEKIVQTVSPIHPDTTQAEMYNVRKGTYQIYLEIILHGTTEIFRSDVVTVEPFIFPDPPTITVTVVGLEERRQLEKVTSDLINKRYRLMTVIADGGKSDVIIKNHKFKKSEIVHAQAKAKEYLMHVDEMLDDCFKSLASYTGVLVLHISWTSTQSSRDIVTSGFRVLVDGKQFGTTLHSGVNNVRIKLNLEAEVHRISMVTVSEKPYGISAQSNVVDVLTDPFRPFVSFCYNSIHAAGETWPSPACCRYDVSVNFERQQTKMKFSHKGLLQKRLAPPQINVLDVFECEFKPLLPESGPSRPTVLVFWSSWCQSSKKMMETVFKFSQFNNHKYDFVSLACGIDITDPTQRQHLVHTITSNGWQDSQAIWHVTNQSASTVVAAQTFIKQNLIGQNGKALRDVDGPQIAFGNTSDLLGLTGVPSIVIIHPNNYIAWMGSYCAFDSASFEVFMEHTMSECLDLNCPVDSCPVCQANTDLFGLLTAKLTQKAINKSQQPAFGTTSSLIIPAVANSWVDSTAPPHTATPPARHRRTQSARSGSSNGSVRSRPSSAGSNRSNSSNISVDKRPFSAQAKVSMVSSVRPPSARPYTATHRKKKPGVGSG